MTNRTTTQEPKPRLLDHMVENATVWGNIENGHGFRSKSKPDHVYNETEKKSPNRTTTQGKLQKGNTLSLTLSSPAYQVL